MLSSRRDQPVEDLEDALAVVFEPLAAELRLVDPADFIAFIRDEKFANLQDIIHSSVELFFKPGTVTFVWGAEFDLLWDSPPSVSLDLEFRHSGVWLVFKLVLRAHQTQVKIAHVSHDKESGAQPGKAALLEALEAARCSPNWN
ncbi:MAG TPA: hypothetical protein VME69_02060 [Methylocella sp.]|nr:hypothetical protein [Methylocella sp.]